MRRWTLLFLLGVVSCVPTSEDEAVEDTSTALGSNQLLPAAVVAALDDANRVGPLARAGAPAPRYGRPIYEPGRTDVAFYEVALAPGWAIVSTGTDARVLELGPDGDGPATRLAMQASGGASKIVRLDMALYVATDAAGRAVAQSSPAIFRFDRSSGQGELVAVSADQALTTFDTARRDLAAAQTAAPMTPQSWPWSSSGPPQRDCTAPGEVPNFRQLNVNESPNTSACYSGCGATAWAMIFGWASKRAASTYSDWQYAGLFRTGNNASGSIVTAASTLDADAGEVTWTIREGLGTFCTNGQGATPPWTMSPASYTGSRAPYVGSIFNYNGLLINENGIRDKAIDTICAGRPSIIGTGNVFSGNGHYPVATAYKNGWFLLNMGWGGSSNGWYQTGTWFTGSVYHN